MKKSLFTVILMTLLLAGCGGITKMKNKSNKVRYQATPNPVETRDDKVVVKFVGSIPEKYFAKNSAMFLQPVFSWEGGAIPLEPLTLKGEAMNGEGIAISYDNGGRFTYEDSFDFREGMETGRVTLTPIVYKAAETNDEAKFMDDILNQNNGKKCATVLLSDGVNTTSTWVNVRGNISISPINYNKTQGVVETADIYFPNSLSTLDWNFEMNRKFNSRNQLSELKRIMLEEGLPKQISITGWASPEGEETNNVGVSKARAEVATAQIKRVLNEVLDIMAERAEISKDDIDYYKYNLLKQLIITTRAAGEDWVHFTLMIEESDLQDKHAIINVVETQQNLIKREQMIRNLAESYPLLKNTIFPNLRRSQIALYYSEARKTDPELAKQASLNPAKLTFDELMYAAYINYNYETKLQYYKWATENHSAEWAAWNNAGAVAFYLGDYPEAERYLNVAREMNPHNPDILNNTGLLCMAQGNYSLAKYYLEEAMRQGSTDAETNIPILLLKQGNYEEAEKMLKNNSCSYNLAFAQLMQDQTSTAIRTLNCCLDQNADVFYLRAVCYARLGSGEQSNIFKNLKEACDLNYNYKERAATDPEFKSYWDNSEFQNIIKLY